MLNSQRLLYLVNVLGVIIGFKDFRVGSCKEEVQISENKILEEILYYRINDTFISSMVNCENSVL